MHYSSKLWYGAVLALVTMIVADNRMVAGGEGSVSGKIVTFMQMLEAFGDQNYEFIENALKTNAFNVNTHIMTTGATLLHIAAQINDDILVKILVNKGKADLESTDNNGETPLYKAAVHGANPKIVAFLLQKGANIHASKKIDMGSLATPSLTKWSENQIAESTWPITKRHSFFNILTQWVLCCSCGPDSKERRLECARLIKAELEKQS